MPAKKRTSAEAETSGDTKGATKTRKTAKGKKAAAAKPAIPASDFKEKARPLHIHITHTPPAIDKKEEAKSDEEEDGDATAAQVAGTITSPDAPIDTGFISNLTLLPSSFSTGSYGWKGSKKINVELQGSEGGEKVQVMLTINATVVGSKQAGKGGEAAEEPSEEAEASE
ncbi:hypothetical protein EST38_g7879 [Candolleomyces aberdarensis]|uniref:Uncharacterized protein n=1 Tax=Candolleomyces aberdarensis TaxID=2316362 RepID=A0A4Q2DE06_9AGAR|nr:hypothetical protein EST38_g7879 [Candolleomyces aberdarensis]